MLQCSIVLFSLLPLSPLLSSAPCLSPLSPSHYCFSFFASGVSVVEMMNALNVTSSITVFLQTGMLCPCLEKCRDKLAWKMWTLTSACEKCVGPLLMRVFGRPSQLHGIKTDRRICTQNNLHYILKSIVCGPIWPSDKTREVSENVVLTSLVGEAWSSRLEEEHLAMTLIRLSKVRLATRQGIHISLERGRFQFHRTHAKTWYKK